VGEDAIDFLVFSGHKLYAPYGAGVLVAPSDAFSDTPDQLGGGIVDPERSTGLSQLHFAHFRQTCPRGDL
jgi:selenocysteine lyase/cysteine desulfurase